MTIRSFSRLFKMQNNICFRMNVSKTCGPFRNHIYMFHVLRGDILKLQEVMTEKFTENRSILQ